MGKHTSTYHRPQCAECHDLNIGRPKSLPDRQCKAHTCPVVAGNRNDQCGRHKSKHANDCGNHPVFPPRPCRFERCPIKPLKALPYCVMHACAFAGCQEFSDAVGGRDFCDAHKCTAPNCQGARKRNKVRDNLELASYCRPHECDTNGCSGIKFQQKSHCEAHCCTFPNCPSARLPDLDTYCKYHYNDQLRADAAASYDAELQAKFRQAQAKADTIRQAKEFEDAKKLAKQLENEKKQREADEKYVRNYKEKEAENQRKWRESEDERIARDLEREQWREWYGSKKEQGMEEKRVREEQERHAQTTRQQDKSAPSYRKANVYVNHKPNHTYDEHLNIPSSSRAREPSTAIPNRSVPKGGTRRYESGGYPEKRYSPEQAKDKRSSTGSYVKVDDEEWSWANSSATHSYDPDYDAEFSRPRPGPGASNRATRGSDTERSVSPEHRYREEHTPYTREKNVKRQEEERDIYGRPLPRRDA